MCVTIGEMFLKLCMLIQHTWGINITYPGDMPCYLATVAMVADTNPYNCHFHPIHGIN